MSFWEIIARVIVALAAVGAFAGLIVGIREAVRYGERGMMDFVITLHYMAGGAAGGGAIGCAGAIFAACVRFVFTGAIQ